MNTYTTAGNQRLLKQLPENAKLALDLGCATGGMARALKEFDIETDGVSFNQAELDLAKPDCRNTYLQNLEQGLPAELDEQYDVVILSHVLEHIADPKRLMDDIHSVLAPGGHILCAIPNMLFFRNRMKLLAGRIEYQDRGIMDFTHVRWYSKQSLIQMFEQHDMQMQSFYGEGNIPLGPLRKLVPASFTHLLDRAFIGVAPTWFSWEFSFVFTAAGKPRNDD